MHTIQLSDDVFTVALAGAKSGGFETVDAYVASLVEAERAQDADIQARFTPEVISYLDEIVAGDRSLTPEEVDANLDKTRRAWLEQNAS